MTEPASRGWKQRLATPFGLLAIFIAVLWGIEAYDTYLNNQSLHTHGIKPRDMTGLDGILWTPFLHADWAHLTNNTLGLATLGWLTSERGGKYLATVTAWSVLAGGAAVWLTGETGSVHIGSSGLVFGFLGAIVGAAIFERNAASIASALLVVMFYSSMFVGLVPQAGISWEGHLFGLLAGMIAAKRLAPEKTEPVKKPYEPEDWELDEPWITGT